MLLVRPHAPRLWLPHGPHEDVQARLSRCRTETGAHLVTARFLQYAVLVNRASDAPVRTI